jgi:predicted metal-dependent phosphoesterase TrpH/glycosyltransferase involved in cell wall biosynthesis
VEPMAASLSIAHVTPYPWEAEDNEVNAHVERVAAELSRRGHRVLVLAPSRSQERVRASRKALRAARSGAGGGSSLLDGTDGGAPRVIAVGEVLDVGGTARRRPSALPIDVARTVEELLSTVPLDFVHVHEPFAPSASSVALRNSRSLNVATFHGPTERILSTQLARPLTRLLFARLDARVASYRATRELMSRFFPGDYDVITPAADPVARTTANGAVQLVMIADEERAALRTLVRALRLLGTESDWRLTVWSSRPLTATPATLSRALRERVRFVDGALLTAAQALGEAEVVILASEGARPTPSVLQTALASGVIPIASGLAPYDELLAEGDRGLLFSPGDAQTLAARLASIIGDRELRESLRAGADAIKPQLTFERLAGHYEQLYARLAARRHDGRGSVAVRRGLAARPLIDVDLHMHTDHSYDCATPVEVLLSQARARGLGAIAVTDHNEISGAHEARAKANGIKVIVGEEVKTAEQGEVIGLFIEERIPRGMTLRETIAEIRRQGGLVYVPHPFDRLHSVPDYEHLLEVLDEIDAIEVFNPRVAIAEFNEEALRFAAKYRIPAGAGSDAHVPQGLGSVRIRMRDFDTPEEFLESLRDADIVRNPASLLYVQALKFLQTKAMPKPARRASRERRVRRTARNS